MTLVRITMENSPIKLHHRALKLAYDITKHFIENEKQAFRISVTLFTLEPIKYIVTLRSDVI